jgi:rare lipoprotein A
MKKNTRNTVWLAAFVLLLLGVSSAAGPASKGESAVTKRDSKVAKNGFPKVQVGKASWYGKAFHGRLTANGETYDMFQFTAAHRTLPLGTMLKVTNLRNNKWIVVRVNDRGPYVGNRIIDLSYGAAQMLDFRHKGIQNVRIEVLEPRMVAMADSVVGFN